jgi:hypothetical protein
LIPKLIGESAEGDGGRADVANVDPEVALDFLWLLPGEEWTELD